MAGAWNTLCRGSTENSRKATDGQRKLRRNLALSRVSDWVVCIVPCVLVDRAAAWRAWAFQWRPSSSSWRRRHSAGRCTRELQCGQPGPRWRVQVCFACDSVVSEWVLPSALVCCCLGDTKGNRLVMGCLRLVEIMEVPVISVVSKKF